MTVLRIGSDTAHHFSRTLHHFLNDDAFQTVKKVLFLEFMIHLNRAARKNRLEFIDTQNYNLKIQEILQYVNDHLSEDLTIDGLAGRFFISKYYMMRLFKQDIIAYDDPSCGRVLARITGIASNSQISLVPLTWSNVEGNPPKKNANRLQGLNARKVYVDEIGRLFDPGYAKYAGGNKGK